jgi:hypothetical protein
MQQGSRRYEGKKFAGQLDPVVAMLGALVGIGLILQLTVRDGISWLAAVHYALSLPLIVGFRVASGIRRIFQKNYWLSIYRNTIASLVAHLPGSRNRPIGDNSLQMRAPKSSRFFFGMWRGRSTLLSR